MRREALNPNSFLRVYDNSSRPALPMVGLRDPLHVSPALIFVPGDSLSFYMSYPVGGGITLTDGSGNSYSMGGASSFAVTGGTHAIVDVTVPAIPDGIYKATTGGMESVFIEVLNDADLAAECSAYITFSHKKVLGKFFYPYAPDGYEQKVRIRSTLGEWQSENSIDTYEETNTGKTRNLQGVYREYFTLRTLDFTQEDHNAASLMSIHDSVNVNGRECNRRPTGAARNSPEMSQPGWDGEISFYDNSATFLVRS